LRAGWVRFAPWIFWIAGGQLALAGGWIGLLVLQSRGAEGSDMPAILWKSGQLAVFGFATYMALVWRSRLRSEVKLRARLVERSDALTGLALPAVFTRQVDAASARAREFGYRNVLVGLQVSNLVQLAKDHGLDSDELALVAAAGAIGSALRDVDVAARIAHNRFVVLVEGVAAEDSPHDIATRFVASGLRADPVRGLRLMVKFQCVALAVAGRSGTAREMLAQLASEPYGTPLADQGTSIRLVAPVSFSPSVFPSSP
jgi:GGDEF domain-containing protein